jgi:hypothetical protein
MGVKNHTLPELAQRKGLTTFPEPANVEGKEREIVRGPIAIKKSLYEECIYNYFIGRIKVQAQQTYFGVGRIKEDLSNTAISRT